MNESTLYTLTVPMRDSAGLARADVTTHVEIALCDIAGGYTATIVDGGWINGESGAILKDNSTRFEVLAATEFGRDVPGHERAVRALAVFVCRSLDQECVLMTRQDKRGIFTEFVR